MTRGGPLSNATGPRTWPGRPGPLGVTWDGEGCNVAVFSEGAESMTLCLLDVDRRAAGSSTAGLGPSGSLRLAEERIPLVEQAFHIWHAYVPGMAPGQRYGFRAGGVYDPPTGRRWNDAKLLVDPYARALTGEFLDSSALDAASPEDSAPFVPHGVVVHDAFPWGDDRPPRTPLADTVLYELHVRGFTMRHPAVPQDLRGTYAGLAHPAAIEHLVRLGVTAVELLPVHHFVSELPLMRRGLTNYWGYNSLGYLAPHAAYSASGTLGQQVGEFKAMVRAFHRAGIEVILDVVYNHTAEGGGDGPTIAFRGLDNPAYYRLEDSDPARYRDYTGCGNTLDARQPHVLQLIMDSLRYWVTEMHVDGFRFDLASALARSLHDVDKLSAFFDIVQQDPVISTVKLIAEPWDVGPGGYQVGEFPPLWAEWNGKYRDTSRSFWLQSGDGRRAAFRDLGYRLTGSSDLYQGNGRDPSASINFVTAHDGFTLADLVAYEHKHNEANGEDNHDGTNDNRSSNGGAEGPTDDTEILAVRRRRQRALLATLLLSPGVPMLTAGDELGRSQNGNNNAYCQDNETSWLDWDTVDAELLDLAQRLVALRQNSPVLRQQAFFVGHALPSGVKDIAWFRPDGVEMDENDWNAADPPVLQVFFSGDAIRTRGARGEKVTDASFLLILNSTGRAVPVVPPAAPYPASYTVEIDTSGLVTTATPVAVPPQTMVVLRAVGAR